MITRVVLPGKKKEAWLNDDTYIARDPTQAKIFNGRLDYFEESGT